jgi:hypothetical protein
VPITAVFKLLFMRAGVDGSKVIGAHICGACAATTVSVDGAGCGS